MSSGYEAARHDSLPRVFPTMAEALKHLEGSHRDSTRPFLRVNSPKILASFIIVGGRKLGPGCAGSPPDLPAADQALVDAWRYEDPSLKPLYELARELARERSAEAAQNALEDSLDDVRALPTARPQHG